MAADLSVSGWLTIPAGEQAHLVPLLEEHIRLTRAEPGCLAFTVTPNRDDRERFDLAERFRDREAFEAHRSRTANSAWGMATRHIVRNFEIAEDAAR